MESPAGIDLDMKLRCSPSDDSPSAENSPSRQNDHDGGGIEISKHTNGHSTEIVENDDCDGNIAPSVSTSTAGDSGMDSKMQHDDGDSGDTTARRGSREGTDDFVEHKSTGKKSLSEQDYEAMVRLVESWKEELYMMNVKNSILLDDMVKVGADV